MTKVPKLKFGLAATPHGKAVRIHTLVDNYLRSDRFKSLSASSRRNYMSCMKSIETLQLRGNRSLFTEYAHRIDYTTADYIKRILSYRKAQSTVALHFSVFSSIWELGMRNGYIANNPWEKARIKLDNLREVVWTYEQIKSAIDMAKECGYDLLALYITMAYTTGQRPYSDLRELKWENFVKQGDRYILDFTIAKTNQHILLPLDKPTENMLLNMPRVSEYIFTDKKGKRLSSTCITNQLHRVKSRCRIPEDLKMRDLRRTAVTELAQAGATVSEITAITGWKCSEKVLNRYAVMRLNTADNALAKRKAFQNDSLSKSSSVLSEPTTTT